MRTRGRWLQGQWRRVTLWQLLLAPLGLCFAVLVALRRWLYRAAILPSVRLPVPVVVVGNITVGGAGKTPLVLWLVQFFRERGYHPGIVSRGYGGGNAAPHAVDAAADPAMSGDEPVLLARRGACPVWVGQDRPAAAQALLAAHPECTVLLCDDGLQHYRLQRDVEIAVVDGVAGFGNGLPLPAGPLRESISRLASVDAVVMNGEHGKWGGYRMRLRGEIFYRLDDPKQRRTAADFGGERLHAVAGIGHPRRFFDHLRGLGLTCAEHAFPDHHGYRREELGFEGALLMTEKDAVKCARLNLANAWVLAVEAEVEVGLGERILEKLRKQDGRETA